MRQNVKIKRIFSMFLMLTLAPVSANAAAIINMADVSKQLEIQTSDGYMPITIEAGRKYYVPGQARFRFKGREVFIERQDEYAIWGDDSFGPQRRHRFMLGY